MGLSIDNESMKRGGTKAVSQTVYSTTRRRFQMSMQPLKCQLFVWILSLSGTRGMLVLCFLSVVAQGVTHMLGRVYRVKL